MNRALVLAAGGVTGALFEVGVLRAIEERYGPLHQLFDVFIGISAGAPSSSKAALEFDATASEPVEVLPPHPAGEAAPTNATERMPGNRNVEACFMGVSLLVIVRPRSSETLS